MVCELGNIVRDQPPQRKFYQSDACFGAVNLTPRSDANRADYFARKVADLMAENAALKATIRDSRKVDEYLAANHLTVELPGTDPHGRRFADVNEIDTDGHVCWCGRITFQDGKSTVEFAESWTLTPDQLRAIAAYMESASR